MKIYSDSELLRMLTEVESDRVERKESISGSASSGIREAICAFANDLPAHGAPGVIFVGARDDGSVSHLEITDQLLLQLADMKTDGQIVPPPSMVVQKRSLGGGEIAVVIVSPSDSPPVRFKGRTCIRIGPRRGVASAQDERILNEKRRHGDQPYDVRPVRSAHLTDLNVRLFLESYLPGAVAPDILAANDRTEVQRLAACKMIATIDDPIPTVLGLLILANRARDFIPSAYIQFLRIAGSGLADPIVDELVIDGTVTEMVRRLDDKLIAHNRVRVDITGGPLERRQPSYPLAALQQLARNALLHRSYEATHAPVRVYWFDDRIEITNPGGPYGTVTPENFGRDGIADYRNPNLAEAMRVLNLIQRFGVGIQIARRALQENGNPALQFDVQPTYVRATLRPAV